MIRNALNRIYANQIANQFCSDEICKAGVLARLNYLNDEQFNGLIANLNSAQYFVAYITKVEVFPDDPTKVRVYNSRMNLITGQVSTGYAVVKATQASNLSEIFRVMNFKYIATIETPEGVRYLVMKSGVGYGISLTKPSGTTIVGGSYVTPGGSVITPGSGTVPGSVNTPGGVVPSTTETSFLTKAALAVAAFLIFKG